MHDVNALDYLPIEPGSFYIMDRGYIDFTRLYSMHRHMAFFVTRAKTNMRFRVVERRSVDKECGLRCDQSIMLTGAKTKSQYPDHLRRIRYVDPDTKKQLVFLTNNVILDALTIALLYKRRWQVELFFEWIKQHLRIKSFYGTSENAVKTQVWIAISVYVLVAIVKKELKLERSLNEILQILSVSLFEKPPIVQALTGETAPESTTGSHEQLMLFDL